MNWSETQEVLEAIRNDEPVKLMKILNGCSISTLTLKNCNDTMLQYACRFGSGLVVKWLIEHGVDVNDSGLSGWAPLIISIRQDNFDVMKMLCLSGADVNQRSRDGRSVLQWCLFCQSNLDEAAENVKIICEHGLKLGINSEDEILEALHRMEGNEKLAALLRGLGFIQRSVQSERNLFNTCVDCIRTKLIAADKVNLCVSVRRLGLPDQLQRKLMLGVI